MDIIAITHKQTKNLKTEKRTKGYHQLNSIINMFSWFPKIVVVMLSNAWHLHHRKTLSEYSLSVLSLFFHSAHQSFKVVKWSRGLTNCRKVFFQS